MPDTTPDLADSVLLVYVTCPDSTVAQRIATALVERRHAACVNIVPGLQSVYRWQGTIETADESLLMIKTRQGQLASIRACVEALHPDELPELIAVDIHHGSSNYLDWVRDETRE